MSVNLRWKKNKDGSQTAYLDIYNKGNRRKKYIGIKIDKGDTDKKEKKILAESIRTKFHNNILTSTYDIVTDDKQESDFLQYYFAFLSKYKKAGIRKYVAAYEKFLLYLKEEGHIKKIIPHDPDELRYKFSSVGPTDRFSFRQLTPVICQGYKDYLYDVELSGLKGVTPFDYFTRFKVVTNKAYEEEYLRKKVTSKVDIKKPENILRKQVLTIDDLKKLMGTACTHSEVRRAFIFACFTGLGEKEIKALKWKDVLDNRLTSQRAKNDRQVTSHLSETAIAVLGEHGPPNQKIFKLPSDVTITKHLRRWIENAGIQKHITFYCGRHTFAVLNVESGTNLKVISDLMGHSSTKHTIKYLNYLNAEKDKATANLPVLDV